MAAQKKVSIIQCKKAVQGYSKENWPEMIEWLREHYKQMDRLFTGRVNALAEKMKSLDWSEEV